MRRLPLAAAAAVCATALPAPAAALPPSCPESQRPCAITGRTLLAGPGDSRLRRPVIVAAAADGRLAVTEEGGERILILTPAGDRAVVQQGDREGPSELAFAPDGTLYAAMEGAIVRYGTDGLPQATFTEGLQAEAGAEEAPDVRDVAVDAAGQVHGLVGDRLLTWDPAGRLVRTAAVASRTDGLTAAGSSVYVGVSGQLEVRDAATGAVQRTVTGLPDGSRTAWITTDPDGRLYLPGKDQLARYAADGSPQSPLAIRHDDANDAGVAVVTTAVGTTVVVVANTAADRLDRFTANGTELEAFGTERGQGLNDPVSVAAAADGRLLVADARDHRVVWFAPDGSFAGTLRDLGQADGAPVPRAAVPLPGGGAAVLYTSGLVEVLDAAGTVARTWTLQNPLAPGGVAVGPDGTLWLRDGSLVTHYATDGRLLGSLRLLIGATAQGGNGLDVAPNGDVWLAGEEELLIVEPTGAIVRRRPVAAPEGVATSPRGSAVAEAEDVLLTGRTAKAVHRWAPNTADARLGLPYDTAYEPSGEVVFVDRAHGELVRIGSEPLPRPSAPAGAAAVSFPPQRRGMRLNPNGTVGVRVACGASAACQGRIRILRRGKRKRGVPEQLGSRRFALKPAFAATFEVPLNRDTRRAAKRYRWIGATAVAVLTGGGEVRYRMGLRRARRR